MGSVDDEWHSSHFDCRWVTHTITLNGHWLAIAAAQSVFVRAKRLCLWLPAPVQQLRKIAPRVLNASPVRGGRMWKFSPPSRFGAAIRVIYASQSLSHEIF